MLTLVKVSGTVAHGTAAVLWDWLTEPTVQRQYFDPAQSTIGTVKRFSFKNVQRDITKQ